MGLSKELEEELEVMKREQEDRCVFCLVVCCLLPAVLLMLLNP